MATHTDKHQQLDTILARNLAWIAAADAKVAPLLAIDTAMLGVIAALLPAATHLNAPQAALTAVASCLLLLSVASLAVAVFPRVSGPRGSQIFFGGIAAVERETYVTNMLKAPVDELLPDLARQCHRNAEIAQRKYTWIRWAMIALFSSVLPSIAAIALLYNASH